MAEEFQRRLPSAEKQISEITSEDIRVAVIGTIVDKEGNTLVLDDGTGKITASFEELPETKENQLVKVFGRIIPLETGFEIQAEFLQDMTGFDQALWKKVRALEI